MKILTIDDDPLVLELLQEAMNASGFKDVTMVDSAVDAAPVISQASPPFDCILIDIRMPEIEGDYLCQWIRTLPEYSATPLIMITALSDQKDIDRSFAAGASDYLTKPIVLSKFIFQMRLIEREIRRMKQRKIAAGKDQPASSREAIPSSIKFAKPFHVGGIDRELDLPALENYAKLCSRSQKVGMFAFSFMIKDAARFHQILSGEDFIDILRTTGEAITTCLKGSGSFLAYAGHGAFVSVARTDKAEKIDWGKLEEETRSSLEYVRILLEDSTQLAVVPCMSPRTNLWGSHNTNVVDIMYRTIGQAEDRCNEKQSA